MMLLDEQAWSQQMFGHSDLGDARRSRRLVDVAARLARHAGQSLARCCDSKASVLGSYRLIENDQVDPDAIAEAGFSAVAAVALQTSSVLLAVEDSTSMAYAHEASGQLGVLGSSPTPRHRGYLVHSTLLVDTHTEHTLGLIEQRYWCRDDAEYGKKHRRKQRAYEDKESYKWQHASERMSARLGTAMERTITVCDRESDVYEYLCYKHAHGQRYVIRAQCDRRLEGRDQCLFAVLDEPQAWRYESTVAVKQRGGRPARQARVRVSTHQVRIRAPSDRGKQADGLDLNVIVVREDGHDKETALNWVLLTSEPVDSISEIKQVVRYYELRWRIEEYHKAWKSGMGAERLRLQYADNLHRMLVILACVAVRLLQLREHLGQSKPTKEAEVSCDQILQADEWQVLWLLHHPGCLPSRAPSVAWAGQMIARLGGFTDTKRTGRPGWNALWQGWEVLQERVNGFRLAKMISMKM